MALERAQIAFTVFHASHFHKRTEELAGHIHGCQVRESQDHTRVGQQVVPGLDLHAPPFVIGLAEDEDHRVIPEAIPELFRVLHGRRHFIRDR